MRTITVLTLAAAVLALAQPVHGRQDRRATRAATARDQLRAALERQQQATGEEELRMRALVEQLRAQELSLQHIMIPDLQGIHDLQAMLEAEQHALLPDFHMFDDLTGRLELEQHLLEAQHQDLLEQTHTRYMLESGAQDALEEAILHQQEARRRVDLFDPFGALFDPLGLHRRSGDLFEGLRQRGSGLDEDAFDSALERLRGEGPRAGGASQDPADSLWRQARERFNANNFRDAARLFGRIRSESRYANSAYRIDAQYWEAYSLSRLGAESDLIQARDLLRAVVRYPATERSRDAEGLLVTVDARLARLGNREAEEALVARATEVRQGRVATTRVTDAVQVAQERSVAAADRAVRAVESGVWNAAILPPGVNVEGMLAWPTLSYSVPRQCRSDEEDIRMVALNALARLDAETALPVLRDVMNRRGECSEHLRRQALSVAARHRTPEAIELIANAARTDPDRVVRTTALQFLLAVDEERGLGMIEERLRSGSDTTSMREAVSALNRRTNNDRAARLLRDVATRSELPASLRRDAIQMLGRHDNAETRRSLRQLYAQSDDRVIKDAILSAATAADAESVDWLLQIAVDTNESERSRQRALSAAARNRAMTVDRLVSTFDQLSDQSLRRTAVNLLGQQARTERAAIDKLLDIARNDTDVEVRKTAIVALSASDDPRARELLLDILRR
jgi:HEAT repeat protein